MSVTNARDTPPLNSRRDALPVWAVIIFILVIARVLLLATTSHSTPAARSLRSSGSLSGSAYTNDDETMAALIQTDSLAKLAFAARLVPTSPTSTVQIHSLLRRALSAALKMEKVSGNEPGAARRVIILHCLMNRSWPAPIRQAIQPELQDPLNAFSVDLPTDLSVSLRAKYLQEGILWKKVIRGQHLTSTQLHDAGTEISSIPNIRWWVNPALDVLYLSQHDLPTAQQFAQKSADTAIIPLLLVFGLIAFHAVIFIIGGLLIVAINLGKGGLSTNGEIKLKLFPNLWPNLPDAFHYGSRRLGSGDLAGVFALYLATFEIIPIFLTGFDFWRFHIHGLLSGLINSMERLPPERQIFDTILITGIHYILSALPALFLLSKLSRDRGASLSEIGWTTKGLGRQIIYGFGGYGIATAVMVPAAILAESVFRHSPDPSNPAIPMLTSASSFASQAILVLLVSVAAPFVEEILFRGVFYTAVKIRLGVWPAIVLTGLVFGMVHPVGVAQMCALATLGAVFAWMAETRKSLAPSICAHFLQNFSTAMLLLLVLAN